MYPTYLKVSEMLYLCRCALRKVAVENRAFGQICRKSLESDRFPEFETLLAPLAQIAHTQEIIQNGWARYSKPVISPTYTT